MRLAEEKRRSIRTPNHEMIRFAIDDGTPETSKPFTGEIIDISATGMGISTDFTLKQNQIVQFKQNQPNWEFPKNGLVVWSYKQDNGCRAGIEFIIP